MRQDSMYKLGFWTCMVGYLIFQLEWFGFKYFQLPIDLWLMAGGSVLALTITMLRFRQLEVKRITLSKYCTLIIAIVMGQQAITIALQHQALVAIGIGLIGLLLGLYFYKSTRAHDSYESLEILPLTDE